MKIKIATFLLLVVLIVQVSGCATPMTQAEQSALGGATLGALIGTIVGYAIGQPGAGAAIGSAIGLGGGYAIGKAIEGKWIEDARRNETTESTDRASYKPEQGVVLRVVDADIAPASVKPGDTVNAKVIYSLLAPTSEQQIALIETRLLQKDGKELARDRKQIEKSQGEYESIYQFNLPSSVTNGRYTVVTTLELGDGQATAQQVSHLNFVVDGRSGASLNAQ